MAPKQPLWWSLALLSIGCGGGGAAAVGDDGPPLPWPRSNLPAAAAPTDNPTTDPAVALGRLLFYDPVLSADGETACATCHSEIWGMSDGLRTGVGHGAGPLTGPGRTGPNVLSRNSQTLWNVGLRETLFWDGRATTLEEQALLPIAEASELGRDPAAVIDDLQELSEYVAGFALAFPEDGSPVTVPNLGRALAAFQRSLVSDNAPYDQYVRGDGGAMGPGAVEGMFAFADMGCADCHVPPRFESDRYDNRGIGVGDVGRAHVTGNTDDADAFRVPTLRNVRETAPYFHDGSVSSLEDAVAHEVARQERAGRIAGEDTVPGITAFLNEGLMDRSQEPDRPSSVPSRLGVPADGFRIPR